MSTIVIIDSYMIASWLAGALIGFAIAVLFGIPLIDRLDHWWTMRHSKPFFDEPVEVRMKRTAELMREMCAKGDRRQRKR